MLNTRVGIAIGAQEVKMGMIEAIYDMGYDYIEMNMADLIRMTSDEKKRFNETIKKSFGKVEAFGVFFPYGFKIVGKEKNKYEIEKYVREASEWIKLLSTELVVIGSGNSRSYAAGECLADIKHDFVEVIKLIKKYAMGVQVVVEPMCVQETNFLNTISEVDEFLSENPQLQANGMLDFYHMKYNNESIDEILERGFDIKHIHISNLDRSIPYSNMEIQKFLNKILSKHTGIRISIEAFDKTNIKDAREMLYTLKNVQITNLID